MLVEATDAQVPDGEGRRERGYAAEVRVRALGRHARDGGHGAEGVQGDDPLSAVDVHTEERILKALRDRPRRNTEVIAAHRLSTIQDADRIAVLAGGRLVQLGRHADLMGDAQGLYRRFYEQQRLREDLERYLDADREVP